MQAQWKRMSATVEELVGTMTTACELGHLVTGPIPAPMRKRRQVDRPRKRGF